MGISSGSLLSLHILFVAFLNLESFRAGFWNNGPFADFYVWAAGFFSRILSPDFSSSFLWEKVPRKILQKIPGTILYNLYNKNPRHISAEGLPKSSLGACWRGAEQPVT